MAVDRRDTLARRIEGQVDRGYRLARAILTDEREAEDAVQDACLTAWQKGGSLRDQDRFDAWFERVLINGCRDRLRRRQRQRVRAIALQSAWTGEGTAPTRRSAAAILTSMPPSTDWIPTTAWWSCCATGAT